MVPLGIVAVAVLSLAALADANCMDSQCRYLMKGSPPPVGIGLYANRNISNKDAVDRCVALVVPDAVIGSSLLNKYVFGHRIKDYSVILLGSCMLFNHNHNGKANVQVCHPISPHPVDNPHTPAGALMFNVVALKDIAEGEELLIDYGYPEDYWRTSGEVYLDDLDVPVVPRRDDDVVSTVVGHRVPIPGCHLLMSAIAGGKVYATQFIAQGDLVEVSRALAVPTSFARYPNLTRYIWLEEHTHMHDDEKVMGGFGILLLGHGALYGSPGRDRLDDANLRYEWYTHERPEDSGSYRWDDLAVSRTALVAIIATRAIELNEELTVPLMVDPSTGQKNVLNRMLPRRSIPVQVTRSLVKP